MNNDYFAEYISAVTKYAKYHHLNPGAAEEVISGFESEYGIRLPQRYREFLALNNGGELFACPAGTVLAEISDGQNYQPGVSYLEYNFDKSKQPEDLPSSLFVIADCNTGDLICLDLSSADGVDCRVVSWYLEIGDIELEWSSIREWLSYEIESGIALAGRSGAK